ncbi:MlaD family protein [Fodinicurvata sp. EGI_FJ10296]|uniref:MlaD family protein n=1 Tax=Fodinicurvata sp. EGI_FJ10296 TaxID=3231908 RepID=UPI003454911E
METRAKYVAVGAFVLTVAGLLLGFAFWLGLSSLTDRGDRYLIYFDGAVTGLQSGSQVRYRGIPVGQVSDIRVDPANIERVRVMIEVDPETPLRDDSFAMLQLAGLTGGSFVQISGGSQDAAMPTIPIGEDYPVIESQPSTLDSLTEQAPDLLAQLLAVTNQAADLLSDDNLDSVNRILSNAESISSDLSGQTEVIAATTDRVGGLMMNLDSLVTEFRVDVARISDRLDTILTSADDGLTLFQDEAGATSAAARELLASAEQAANSLNTIVSAAGPGLEDFANTGLYEFTIMTTELRDLARNLSRVIEQIERSPTQFLLGPRGGTGVPVE